LVKGAVVVGGVAAVGALASRAFAASSLPMKIVNNTGRYPNSAIHLYIVGTNLSTGQQSYVNRDGALTPVSTGLNGPDGFADLSIPLDSGGDTKLTLPNMSGRVYFSIDQKLKFRVVAGGGRPALQFPAGWVPTDPNYNVLHDCIEFTFNDAGMFCNTTMVDMFSIPLAIQLTGQKSQTTGTLVAGGRDRIFSSIAALPDFRRLVVGDNLRVIAPGHGLDNGLFSKTYFDSYIDQVWARYASTDLVVKTNANTFTGRVQGGQGGGQLVFNNGARPFAKPTTRDVLFCDGALIAPNDGVSGPIAAMLGAAFNRSTLRDHPDQPVASPATYYQVPISNHYSRVMHENTVDRKAYGFAFDDVLDLASYIQDHAPRSLTVTLTPFGSAPTPGPIPVPPPATASPTTASPTTTPPGGVRSAYSTIQAASFTAHGGTSTQPTADTGGGSNLSGLGNGDWVRFDNVDFGPSPAMQFQARVASGAAGGVSGLVEVRLDSRSSTPIGTFGVADTGGWQSWRTVPANIAAVTGVHTVFVTFTSGQPADFVNLNWVTFGR